MHQYEVKIIVFGKFPKELVPRITKDIMVETDEKLETKGRSKLSITAEGEDVIEGYHNALKKIVEFLSFYAIMTLNNMRIVFDESQSISAKELTGSRKEENFNFKMDTVRPTKEFTQYFMPHYLIILKKGNEYLRTAMEFLYQSRFEHISKFKIINCIVALEDLLTLPGQGTEVGYKISNRAAILLAKDGNERKKLRKEFKDFYNLRSRIVHGEFVDLGAHDFGLLVLWTRMIIMMFLGMADDKSHQTIIDEIDDAIIDNDLIDTLREKALKTMNEIQKNQ